MRFAILLTCLCAACTTNLPDIDDTISQEAQNAPYPELSRLPVLLAQSEAGSSVVDETAALEARIARLKARAAALKGRDIYAGAEALRRSGS